MGRKHFLVAFQSLVRILKFRMVDLFVQFAGDLIYSVTIGTQKVVICQKVVISYGELHVGRPFQDSKFPVVTVSFYEVERKKIQSPTS